jgi:hypothetical protein
VQCPTDPWVSDQDYLVVRFINQIRCFVSQLHELSRDDREYLENKCIRAVKVINSVIDKHQIKTMLLMLVVLMAAITDAVITIRKMMRYRKKTVTVTDFGIIQADGS